MEANRHDPRVKSLHISCSVCGLWIKIVSFLGKVSNSHFVCKNQSPSWMSLTSCVISSFLSGHNSWFKLEPSSQLTGWPRIPIPSVLLSFCVTEHPMKATSEGSEAYRQHSMVSSFKPRSYCLSLKLNRQPLCTEIERLFR